MSPQPLQVPGLKVINVIIALCIHRSTCHLVFNVIKLFLARSCQYLRFYSGCYLQPRVEPTQVEQLTVFYSKGGRNVRQACKVLQVTNTLAYLS
jgi:hypothetical protein